NSSPLSSQIRRRGAPLGGERRAWRRSGGEASLVTATPRHQRQALVQRESSSGGPTRWLTTSLSPSALGTASRMSSFPPSCKSPRGTEEAPVTEYERKRMEITMQMRYSLEKQYFDGIPANQVRTMFIIGWNLLKFSVLWVVIHIMINMECLYRNRMFNLNSTV
ncbi:unnamed protein product, partial [Urochloa humidicola]